ncbi:MAG TPA: response regulator [Mycobacteriales bacterium]|nr:response regulator [Mycobacteriales bacterium]
MFDVLIVEDEPDLRALIVVVLGLRGFTVRDAPHGAAALELLAAEGLPHVIVTDRMMPVMGGEELIARLRADPTTSAIPILMLSANPPDEPGVPVIRKPFGLDDLCNVVDRLAGDATTNAENARV